MSTNYAEALQALQRAEPVFNDACPIWCTGHKSDSDEQNHTGHHWLPVQSVGWSLNKRLGYEVSVSTGKSADGGVYVTIDAECGPDLTPEQAREVARQVLEASEWVEKHRNDPLHGSTPADEVAAHNLTLAAWEEVHRW